jgi:hypothetical protein
MRIILLWLGIFLASAALFGYAQAVAPSQDPAASATTQPTQAPAAKPSAATEPQQSATGVSQESLAPKRHIHFRLGTITVGAGYSHWSGVPYYPYPYYAYEPYGFYPYRYYDYGAYSPWLWDPFWTGLSSLAYPSADKGEVRLTGAPKTAQVFLDGAYAGTAGHLKSMWLKPGAYDLSVSMPNHKPFHQRIYVLSGKSLKITADLVTENLPPSQEAKP